MMGSNLSFRNRPVVNNRFAMNPAAQVERSVFTNTWSHKTTFDAGYLIPHFVDEVIPGDSFHVQCTMLGRLQTPVFPLMDDLYLDTFYFFVPARLVWTHWANFMGERSPNVDSSISFTVPQAHATGPSLGNSLAQYMGVPWHMIAADAQVSVNALPFRCYMLCYNEWFRDEDIINKEVLSVGDGPDVMGDYHVLKRAKIADYFTKARPWPEKGGVASAVSGTGDVRGIAVRSDAAWTVPASGGGLHYYETGGEATYANAVPTALSATAGVWVEEDPANALHPRITADFSIAINQLREATQIQVLLERDARGGTRYTEILESHFGVKSPDARLQRPEYLGGGSQRLGVTTVPQTSETGETPLGNLGAAGMVVEQHGFSGSFVEHGYVIGLVNVRSVPSYQQGLARMWTRSTRFDFPWPAFTHLGEQAVLRKELYYIADSTSDDVVFGYMPRYEEYRFHKSLITGEFRSGVPGSIDQWHLAQQFSSAPTLSKTFLEESPPMERVLAAGADADGLQIMLDCVFTGRFTRPLPAFGTPQLGGRF
jgi:hypothetical protein